MLGLRKIRSMLHLKSLLSSSQGSTTDRTNRMIPRRALSHQSKKPSETGQSVGLLLQATPLLKSRRR